MFIPLNVPCTCGTTQAVWIRLRDPSVTWRCDACNEQSDLDISEVSVGTRLLDASGFEWERGDYSRSIIFSAMAFECHLSDVYKKWAGDRYEDTYRDYDEPSIEAELRRWSSIRRRVENVAEYLDRRGFEEFIAEHPTLQPMVVLGFPATLRTGAVLDGIEKGVFWKRNRILHFGYDASSDREAREAFNLALFGIDALKQLDAAMTQEAVEARRRRSSRDAPETG